MTNWRASPNYGDSGFARMTAVVETVCGWVPEAVSNIFDIQVMSG